MGQPHPALERLQIERPTLILDKARALRNIDRMAARARSFGVAFRPHFKTHQSIEVGSWFRGFGVSAIAVSSVEMARYFADDGWSDITIAFPVNLRELAAIDALAERVRLGVIVDSMAVTEAVARVVSSPLRVWLKIDAGYGRAGVAWDDEASLTSVGGAVAAQGKLELAGVLTHNGLTYRERTAGGVIRSHGRAMERMRFAREVVAGSVRGECALSIGDTPSACLAEDFAGVDEMRPGNFVFNDLIQVAIGSCAPDDIAVAVACPVVAVYPERRRALLYGGAVHLSLDSIEDERGVKVFGRMAAGWPDASSYEGAVVSISQEHGLVELAEGPELHPAPGALVCVLPVHSCLTCNLYPEYVTLEGERVENMRCARRF